MTRHHALPFPVWNGSYHLFYVAVKERKKRGAAQFHLSRPRCRLNAPPHPNPPPQRGEGIAALLCGCQRTEKAGSGSACLFPLTPALSLQTCDAHCVASPPAVRRPPHPALRQAQGHPLPPGERERQEPLSRWERGWGEGETALWAAEQLNVHHTFQGRGGGSGRHRVGATPCGCPLPQRSRAM